MKSVETKKYLMKMHAIGFYFILLSISSAGVNATHFRGAIFTWTSADDGSTITIRFRISWRRSSGGNWCDDDTISNHTLTGSGHIECFSGCTGNVGSLAFLCTDYSTTDDWSSGRNDIIYTVSSTKFSFRFSSCCWISTLKIGKDSPWSVLATVDLSVRSDTGRINSAPTVEMPPVLNLQDGCPYNITLLVKDVDGDVVKCRWANGPAECENVCNGFTGAVLDEEACIISYTPNGNQGLYAAALQIEDFASIQSTLPLSSIPLQFIVRVYNGNGCDDVPEFIDPTPYDRSCFALDVGDNFNVTVTARGSQLFNRITTLSAVGMVRSSEKIWLDSTWHYIEMNVTWTPTEDDIGQDHSLCFYATDLIGVTSETRCINLPVSVSGPTPLRVERIGLSNTWTIIIDQTFSRPTEPAYIKVFETSNSTEIVSLDASVSSDVVFDPIHRQINVTFEYNFDIEEDYHVTIPSGLVEGFVSCGALSVAVNDSGFWEIEVDCGEHTLLNGEVIAPNGTDYPHSVFYECNIGHDLVGVSNRSCTANGTWTGSEPFCSVRDCGFFFVPENGNVSTNSTIYNTRVIFYCDEGYEISGNSSIYCEHTAVWSTPPPVCILVDCKHPANLDNGNVSIPNGTTYGMTAYYSCHLGYDLIGVSDRQCQQGKQWSGTRPFCSPKDCGLLFPPTDGTIDMINTTVGNTVTYECDMGFILQGDHVRVCLRTGQWNGSGPICDLADCGQLQSPSNGNVIASGSTYKSVGIFSCNQGYNLNGNNISECQANGSWSSWGQFCKIVDLEESQKYCGRCGTRVRSGLSEQSGTQAVTSLVQDTTHPPRTSSSIDLQLSPGAAQSYFALKKRYKDDGSEKPRKKQKSKTPETVTIGVQILDKNQTVLRKAFRTAIGSVGTLHIDASSDSDESDWIEKVSSMFCGISFSPRLLGKNGFMVPEHTLTMKDLERDKKVRKIAELRLFLIAEGKGKMEIKKAFRGDGKQSAIKKSFWIEVDDEDDSYDKQTEVQKTAVTCQSEEKETEEKETAAGKKHLVQDEIDATTQKQPHVQKTTVTSQSEEKETAAGKKHLVQDEIDATTQKQPHVQKTTVTSQSEEKETSAGKIHLTQSDELMEDDHELEKFLRLQRRLEERKQEATMRVRHVNQTMKKLKQFTIFYLARNNVGMTFKAPLDVDIGYLYDMVCHLLEANVTAPKFHLTSGSVTFDRSYKGKLKDIPSVLQLVEEEFTPDDTLTAYDDVIF